MEEWREKLPWLATVRFEAPRRANQATSSLGAQVDESLRILVASYPGLNDLAGNNQQLLKEVKDVTAGVAMRSGRDSDMSVGGMDVARVLRQEECLKKLESLVQVAKRMQHAMVSVEASLRWSSSAVCVFKLTVCRVSRCAPNAGVRTHLRSCIFEYRRLLWELVAQYFCNSRMPGRHSSTPVTNYFGDVA